MTEAAAPAPAPTATPAPASADIPTPETAPAPAEAQPNAEGATPPEQGKEAEAAKPESADTPDADTGAEAEAFTIDVPEGAEAFEEAISSFSTDMDTWLKDNPNATAQEALQEAAARQLRTVNEQAEAATQQFEQQVSEWGDTARSDKEIGGEQFDANVAIALEARDKFGTPEMTQVLNDSGLGNHPEIIRFFYRVGKGLAEPGLETGADRPAPSRNLANSLYGNPAKT